MRRLFLTLLILFLLGSIMVLLAPPSSADGPAVVYLPVVANLPTTLPPVVATDRWSNPATWASGSVPQANEAVVIPAGKKVLLDVSPPALASLTIQGALVFDRQDLSLTTGWIALHDGTLAIGSSAAPFTHRATITLTASDPAEQVMGMGTRGILLMGLSRLDLVGAPPAVAWTQLGDHAAAGASQLTLKQATSWRPGDRLVVAPTDYYHVGATELHEVASATGATLSLRTPLQARRWGKLQYISASGMTTAPTTAVSPLVLDERAEVGNLTRNIVIQGADDALWRNQGFGAQVMLMEGSAFQMDGVELRRMGQRGTLRRYALHFHGLSYRPDGTSLGAARYASVQNSTIWDSENRCIVVHGSDGVVIRNNICYNIKGHAIFLEDGVERNTLIEGNLVLHVRNPAPEDALLLHELDSEGGASSAFWITNPANVLRRNVAADSQGLGIWYALPDHLLGLYKQAGIFPPKHTRFGVFEHNVTHSNGRDGFQIDWAPSDDLGNLTGSSYRPTANGKDPNNVEFSASIMYTMRRLTSYKNEGSALWHREGGGVLDEFISADNPGRGFSGSANCIIQNSVSIGHSLNNANGPLYGDGPSGIASYHSSCDVKDHLFVDLPFVEGKASGALDTSDYYIRPVDKGLFRSTNLRFINTPFGYRTPPFVAENWTLAGALWDPYGYVGPRGNYWVYDTPFLTAGTTCQAVQPAGKTGTSCVGPYYGLSGFVPDQANDPWGALMPIEVRRDNGSVWSVGDGTLAPKLGNMRHAALLKGGTFTLRLPQTTTPRNMQVTIENMTTPDDWVILGMPLDGTVANPMVYATSWLNAQDVRAWSPSEIAASPYVRLMQPAASLAEVRASAGTLYYQDTANNLVYMKVRNGLQQPGTPVPGSNDDLYRQMSLVAAER
jgi:hypothetical protein